MAREGREYLSEIVDSVICLRDAFRIGIGGDKYIFSAMGPDAATNNYFAVSAIYDSICDVDTKIKYAFKAALECDFPETLMEYDPFSMPTVQERIAMYHVENIVFRVSILWDLLAQLCNVIYQTGISPDKINYNRYFRNHSTGSDTIPICQEIVDYLDESEDISADTNPWPGNHAYLSEFRNQMTHRASPNISSMSTLGTVLRPPVMYVLHRAIEDYYRVSCFLCGLINKFLTEHENWVPHGFSDSHEEKEVSHRDKTIDANGEHADY